jgi:hypothetical protein
MTFCKELLHEAHAERLDAIKFVWEREAVIAKIDKKIGFLEAKPETSANLVAIDELYEQKEGQGGRAKAMHLYSRTRTYSALTY